MIISAFRSTSICITNGLTLQRRVPRATRSHLLGRLAETHNDWANWHLENGEYGKARKAMSKAVVTQFTAKAAAKLVLATLAPAIALKEFRKRDEERKRRRVIA